MSRLLLMSSSGLLVSVKGERLRHQSVLPSARPNQEVTLMNPITRRRFLAHAASAAPALLIRQTPVRFSTNPFTLGVASGYPLPNGVALWTRLAPALLLKTLKSMLHPT